MKSLIAAFAMLGMVATATVLNPAPASARIVVHVGAHPAHYHWRSHHRVVVRVGFRPVPHRWHYARRGVRHVAYYCVRRHRRILCYR